MPTAAPTNRLDGLHPDLKAKVTLVLSAMASLGHPMRVVQGLRTTEQQQALYAKGRTAPGPKVTNCDGVTHKSNHQAKEDGFGYAVDCAFQDDPTTKVDETWADSSPWELFGHVAESQGLVWGGRWRNPVDRPHIELPTHIR